MLKWTALFGVAVIAGYVGGRMRPAADPGGAPLEREDRPGDRAKAWKRDDLLGWIRESDTSQGSGLIPNSVSPDLKAWSNDDLRAALNEALADPSAELSHDRTSKMIGWLIAEWMSRDPDALVAWFEGLGVESQKRRVASSLGAYWPKDRVEEGLALVIRNRESFDTSDVSSWTFVQGAIGSAAQRGPAAVDAVLAQLRMHKLDPFCSFRASFPEGFDFAALAASPAAASFQAEGKAFFAGQWMKADPEEAFDYFKDDLMLEGGGRLRLLFLDVMPGWETFDPAAGIARAEWLAARITSLGTDERRKIATDSIDILAGSPVVLGKFVAALEDPGIQADLSRAAWNRLHGIGQVLDYFEATGDEGQRLQLLEESTVGWPKWSVSNIGERNERLLRERLSAWNASPERIAAIVRNVKGVRE